MNSSNPVIVALLAFVWQGSAIGVLLGVILALAPERAARPRYVACCVAMAALAFLPILTAALAYTSRTSTVTMSASALAPLAPTISHGVMTTVERWIIAAWACGVALVSMRFLVGLRHVRLIRDSLAEAPPAVLEILDSVEDRLGMRRRARLGLTEMADSPVVFGWRRPTILLPASTIVELTRDQLEAVLAHELAHVRRYDFAVNLAQVIVETALFYHPATWWVSSRMRRERERCCDDSAVALSGDPATYVRALLQLERSRPASPMLALGLGADAHELLPRIRRLLRVEAPLLRAATSAVAIAGFVVIASAGSVLDTARRDAARYDGERSARANQMPIAVQSCSLKK